jgi:hypothetical protein
MLGINVGSNTDGRTEAEVPGAMTETCRMPHYITLAEMFYGRSPDAWRAEYAGAFAWGDDIGREATED